MYKIFKYELLKRKPKTKSLYVKDLKHIEKLKLRYKYIFDNEIFLHYFKLPKNYKTRNDFCKCEKPILISQSKEIYQFCVKCEKIVY